MSSALTGTSRILLAGAALLIFSFNLLSNIQHGRAADSLWACHLSTLLLGFGILLGVSVLIRIATLWIVVGVPLWLYDLLLGNELRIFSSLTHIGGLLIALYALSIIGFRSTTWLYALLLFFVLQAVCSVTTPEVLNVNVSQYIRAEWQWLFSSYSWYWIFNTLLGGFGMYIADRVLMAIFHKKSFAKKNLSVAMEQLP